MQSSGVLQVAGAAKMAGILELAFADLATLPGTGDTLTIVSAKSITGGFDNAASGTRLATTDGKGSFRVNIASGTNAITLSYF